VLDESDLGLGLGQCFVGFETRLDSGAHRPQRLHRGDEWPELLLAIVGHPVEAVGPRGHARAFVVGRRVEFVLHAHWVGRMELFGTGCACHGSSCCARLRFCYPTSTYKTQRASA
jgi:hypothetical protein